MAKARRLAHELEERRALVGLVRVRPAEGVLSPPAQGTREALASADVGAFPWQAAFLGKIEPRAARVGPRIVPAVKIAPVASAEFTAGAPVV